MKNPSHATRDVSDRLSGEGQRYGLVASRFNGEIVERLVEGARDCLLQHGVEEPDIETVWVPGAFELPLALEEWARSGDRDGLVALGAVIRGQTPHFEYVCSEASRGISRVSLRHRVPVGFGLLTCDRAAQAQERAGGSAGNKGWEAALASLEMVHLLRHLRRRGAR